MIKIVLLPVAVIWYHLGLEYFQKRMAEILDGLPGVANLMDDILVDGETKQEQDECVHAVLERLTLNRGKCSFCITMVALLGYVVDSSGIPPHLKIFRAINEMATPSSVADISWARQTIGQDL